MTSTSAVTDIAVEAAAEAVMTRHWVDEMRLDEDQVAMYRRDARAALEAALPHLTPQPVASRERVEKALRGKPIIRSADKPEGWRGGLSPEEIADITDALLAAGVFREPPN